MDMRFVGKYELFLEVQLNRSIFLLYANNIDNEFHIVDLNSEGTRSVTNNMDIEFLNDIMRGLPYDFKQRFNKSMADIRYFWIGTDGVASEFLYETEEIKFMNPAEYAKIVPIFEQYLNKDVK